MSDLQSLFRCEDSDSQQQALIVASELECALHDLAHPAADTASVLTDQIARNEGTLSQLSALERAGIPENVILNTPEGFAFYALPISGYVDCVTRLAQGRPIAAVGIRSAGVALSAIAAAKGGSRITVRPTGHPYDRELTLDQEQFDWVRQMLREDREFFVLDEGPGLSGSSFLASAEALEAAGVSTNRIHLIGNNERDPDRLVASNAGARWRRFDFHVVSSRVPAGMRHFANGDWHSEFLADQDSWPATWAQMTPPKYMAEDGKSIWKFEGLGTHGELAYARAQTLGQYGYAPRTVGRIGGFVGYERLAGEPLGHHDLDDALIDHMAGYLACRKSSLACNHASSSELELMTAHNVRQMLDLELRDFHLHLKQPVVCDARMMPHEWVQGANEQILKLDATSHGDNHFFPGPCDIAWDIAGAIVEWQMSPQQSNRFIEAYESRSGDRVRERLSPYLIAYASFQAAYAKMAWNSILDVPEKARFERDFERYVSVLKRLLGDRTSRAAGSL